MVVKAFWVIVMGSAVGIFFRSFVFLDWWAVGFLALLATAILFLGMIRSGKKHLILAALLIASCAGGVARMHSGILQHSEALDSFLGGEVVLEGVVSDEPDVRDTSVRISVRVESIEGSSVKVDAGVLAIVPLHTSVAYGDRVRIEGSLRLPEKFGTGEGRVFDYPKFLAKDGIGYVLSFARLEKIGSGEGNVIKAGAIWIKQTFLRGLTYALSEPQAGLAGGITVGDKRGLGKELSHVFQTVSLTHVVVLSGYNIMIVIYGLVWVMKYLRLGKWWQFWIGVSVAIFFALITGLASASVRAALMAIIAMVGEVSGRVYLAARSLAVVAFCMLMWNPYVLAFDPGFQLSVIATIGLITLSPIVVSYLSRVPKILGLREVASSSVAAQISVLPLLLYQGGQFSLYSLPANLLALVAVPYAMFFSLVASIVGLLLGPLGPILAFPAYALLSYIIYAAKSFASLPLATIPIPAFSAVWLAVVYGALISAYCALSRNAPRQSSN